LASAAQAVYKVSSHARAFAYRTYPFASPTVAAFFRGNPERCGYSAGCASSHETYAAGLHLFLAVANAKAAKDAALVLYFETDLVDAKI